MQIEQTSPRSAALHFRCCSSSPFPLYARAIHRSAAKVLKSLKDRGPAGGTRGALGFRGATCGGIVRIGTRGDPSGAHHRRALPAFRERSGAGLGDTLDAAPHAGLARPDLIAKPASI